MNKYLGVFIQLGGIVAAGIGLVLSIHHLAIAACFTGGAIAWFVGSAVRKCEAKGPLGSIR